MQRRDDILELLKRAGGAIRLRPEFVHRFYPDLNRLGQKKLKRSSRQFIPERWIGSSIVADNPATLPAGGLSMIDDRTMRPVALRDAIKLAPLEMVGQDVLDAHGPEFRVLAKVLDPGIAIPLHLHANDAQVKRMKRAFRGHRFGKDEAYYILDAPKGPQPYTHVGLHEGVTRAELIAAIARGPEHALELSPSFYQEIGQGFFLPAAVPHRPGTALTLEVQQPSDVSTMFDDQIGARRLTPAQMHPGFRSLEDAIKLIDLELSQRVGRLQRFRLTPTPIERKHRGGEVATIFPAEICRTFAGRRIRVSDKLLYSESLPFVLWIWRGRGRINGRPFRAGDEFFIAHDTAAHGIDLQTAGDETLEAFSFLPVI